MNEEELNNEQIEDEDSIDPWEAAFAAIEKAGTEDEPGAGEGDSAGAEPSSTGAEPQPAPVEGSAEQGDSSESDDDIRRTGDDVQGYAPEIGEDTGALSLEGLKADARNRAIDVVAKTMKEKGYHFGERGSAGYHINDLMKRDDDGVISFINPDTGREFEGSDPRSAAKQWVDAYNSEFRETFNNACQQVEAKILEQYQPIINVLEFGDTYEKLDDVRKNMLDAILEDYEVRQSDGTLVGFSIPMERALRMVNTQVARLQDLGKRMNMGDQRSPEVDMKSAAKDSSVRKKPEDIKSLEEALAYQQEQLLEGRN